jgi:hypothetical protein
MFIVQPENVACVNIPGVSVKFLFVITVICWWCTVVAATVEFVSIGISGNRWTSCCSCVTSDSVIVAHAGALETASGCGGRGCKACPACVIADKVELNDRFCADETLVI